MLKQIIIHHLTLIFILFCFRRTEKQAVHESFLLTEIN